MLGTFLKQRFDKCRTVLTMQGTSDGEDEAVPNMPLTTTGTPTASGCPMVEHSVPGSPKSQGVGNRRLAKELEKLKSGADQRFSKYANKIHSAHSSRKPFCARILL